LDPHSYGIWSVFSPEEPFDTRVDVGVLFPVAFVPCPTLIIFIPLATFHYFHSKALAATVSMAAGFASQSTNSKIVADTRTTVNGTTNFTSQVLGAKKGSEALVANKSHKLLPFSFSPSCLPSTSSSNSVRGREPTLLEKQIRRMTVFKTAFGVFVEYKWAQRKAKKMKKKLGLDLDDPNSDDHPEIMELWSRVHERNAQKLLEKIQTLEGFWVKVGQYLSSRADVMPPEYLQTLAQLQDSMPPRSWKETWETIQEELGEEALERFESIDPEPLSTASLAQVHRATLKEHNGERHDVVIKVQHRGVASLMLQDMENLRVILQLLAYSDPDLDFGPVIREYNQEVRKELDFRTEAQNMNDVSHMLKKADIAVIIPDTISDLVTERVLVMDFCHGFPVRDTQLLDEYNVDRELLLERVCAAWAVQMHVGGVFNADPHMGNILVSTAVPGDPSVPVLLDFGLTKRLDPPIQLAFARLMHASHESDVDALLQSFDEMGLKMNRYDPFEDMAAMQRGFGNTVPQSKAREIAKQKSQDYQRRMEAKRAEEGLQKGQKLRNPVEAWPSELVFFGRVTNMLRGMCSRLDVSYPYLQTMAVAARETLRSSVPQEEHAVDLIHPSASAISTPLQLRLLEALPQIHEEGHMVGLQICVLQHGKEIANIAAGSMGTANPRPVSPSTLFNVFSVSKGILTIGLLRLVQDGLIGSVDDPVAKYWPAFENKPTITIRHVLTHQAGLANVYPEDATLDTLLDWSTMLKFMAEEAVPSHEPGSETQYHALSYAWLVGGIIEAVTGKPYEQWLDKVLPYNSPRFPGEEETRRHLFLSGISKDVDDHKDLAVLSLDRRSLQNSEQNKGSTADVDLAPETKSPETVQKDKENEDERAKKARKVLAKYKGLQQLMNPSIFNMRKVREARLPSANGHASAASLAEVFDAVIRSSRGNPILSPDILELARTPSRTNNEFKGKQAMLDDAQASFGLGFQLHEFTLPNGDKGMSIGHAGLGGSVVLAIPEEEVVIALTLNHLSADSVARRRILGTIFEELGWKAPASIPVEGSEAARASAGAASSR
jgi:aarF domain-containing kinase